MTPYVFVQIPKILVKLHYKELVTEVTKEKYAMIVDESSMFGGQGILTTLGVESEKKR